MKDGWEFDKLGSLCKTGSGGTPLKNNRQFYDNGKIPWLRSGEVNNRRITKSELKITEEGLSNSSAKLFPPRTVLIAMYGATAGEVGILDFECSTNQAVCGIYPNRQFLPDFLYYFFLDFKDQLIAQAAGNAQPNISQAKIKNTIIPIPPLSEQKQIVAILDKAFAAIDQAKANIEKNIENAKELFQSKLNEVFSQKGEGWEEKSIQEISTVVNGHSFKSQYFSADNEIKAIKITNVGVMEFIEDSSNYLPLNYLDKHSNVKVNEGNLVLALTRTIISKGLKVARVPASYDGSLLNQRVAAVIPDSGIIHSDFLYYYFGSRIVYNYVLNNVNTLMQPNLSISDLKRMPVPIVSMEKQRKISTTIKRLSNEVSSLENHLIQKKSNLDDLKKSILQKAFAGELT